MIEKIMNRLKKWLKGRPLTQEEKIIYKCVERMDYRANLFTADEGIKLATLCIQQAKEEVFDDIDKLYDEMPTAVIKIEDLNRYVELKKRHLSTL